MPIGIKIIELSKEPLFIVYRKKKRIYYWLRSKGLVAYKELGKGKA